jgi:cyclophilin family peptidyl-prolyl cis-trans isomerase
MRCSRSLKQRRVRTNALQIPVFAFIPRILCSLLAVLLGTALAFGQTAPPRKKNAPPPGAGITAQEAAAIEAVITTELGAIRIEFHFDKAPKHVQHFVRNARAGYYNNSAFHRVIERGLIQGGDPLLKDPKTPRSRWGTGGLNELPDEFSDIKHVRGTVSTVRIPGKANSGGAQFFICASPQQSLDGEYSAFGSVTEGLEVVELISFGRTDAEQKAAEPIRILSVTIEPKKIEPFKDATVDEMRKEVLLRTSLGDITVALDPELAPEHVRNFLKLVETGWYDGTAFHRIIPGFVIQGGLGATRQGSKPHPADRWVRRIKGEFSSRRHLRGVLSMARTEDPDSAETSFFLMLAPAPFLDNKYTVFGRMVDGFEVIDKMAAMPRTGETPTERIDLIEAVIKP